MAELTKSGGIDPDGALWSAEMPPELVAEFRGYRKAQGYGPGEDEVQTKDELFDMAYDFVSHHGVHGPWAEQLAFGEGTDEYYEVDDLVVEVGREWAYSMMEAIGEPYHASEDNPAELKRRLTTL